MKVFIQIPCLNEELTLPLVIKSIPKKIKGIDKIEILVIDDGSTDKTVEVAKSLGVKHILIHTSNLGYARSFRDGTDYSLKHGADIIVCTDGDNQYPQDKIDELIAPILKGEADIVIGDRQTSKIKHFSPFKKLMQRFGSIVVSIVAGIEIPDAASGFRAYSKKSILRINIITQFSYTMESIIQAANKRLRIATIPITTNEKTRESRLFKNIWQHMFNSGKAIIRSYLMFKPYTIFFTIGSLFFIAGSIPFIRFILFFIENKSSGHIQSLIFGSVMMAGALISFALMIISDLLRINRILLEDQLERIKEIQYKIE